MFIGASYCSGIAKSSKPDILSYGQKVALITELALAALVVAAGVLAILASNGVPLDQLSSFGALGTQNGLIMMGVGLGVFIVDMIAMMIQYKIRARYCNEKHSGGGQLRKDLDAKGPAKSSNDTAAPKESDGLSTDLADKDKKIQSLEEALTNGRKTLDVLRRQRDDALAAVERGETELTHLKGQLAKNEKAYEKLDSKLKRCVADLESRESELKQLRQQSNTAAGDVEEANKTITTLKEQISISSNRIADLEAENDTLKAKIEELEEPTSLPSGSDDEEEEVEAADDAYSTSQTQEDEGVENPADGEVDANTAGDAAPPQDNIPLNVQQDQGQLPIEAEDKSAPVATSVGQGGTDAPHNEDEII